MDRRQFLGACALAPLAGCAKPPASLPPGAFLGPDPLIGHRLREDARKPEGATEKVGVLIVGAGIGGLSAAWWLRRGGFDDFLVAELQPEPGGNSRSGANAISAFPLAAHYLPLPTLESQTLRLLLADLGALRGDPFAAKPVFDEALLCAAPQERLFLNGLWQEGLVPEAGLSARERDQIHRFFARVGQLRGKRGAHKPFALPMARSSREADLVALDRLSFREWLLREGFDSEALHWHADYACRDDYGTASDRVSAWAGLHYFACRDGEAEGASSDTVLTSPGGNGWIARGMADPLVERLRCGTAVTRLQRTRSGWEAWLAPASGGAARRVEARAVIWASPLFLAAHLIQGLPDPALSYARSIEYAPWLLAQLSMKSSPEETGGVELAWDNVLYRSAALGYVVANHQRFALRAAPSVWTWYHAFAGEPASMARMKMLMMPREHWIRMIADDLAPVYPDLLRHVERIDLVRHGHAMARPVPGFLSSAGRHWFAAGMPDLQFAHADVSGFSLCEEAHSRGVCAAERVLARLRGRPADSAVLI
jgi:glycine/D-amino acid oxidase-like deaminating enzyme